MAVKRRSSNKNPPIFSHEFIIQNHADIVACVAMLFVVGLMFQVTSPLASVFIALHHNASLPVEVQPGRTVDITFYTAGLKDVAATFFYLLIAVVMHQIIQEYLLDKINRKLHLSKVKHAKFNESGQLLAFYLVSLIWAGDLLLRENLFNIRSLWEGYPHLYMSFMLKFFFLIQIAYWLHTFPELYFQKVKREDMPEKIKTASVYLAFIATAYVTSFTRVGLSLLLLHYAAESLFHAGRLLSYAERESAAAPLLLLHDVFFVLARLGSILLAVLTFWYGLALAPAEHQILDLANGNFNVFPVRILALGAIGILQAALMWDFITFQLQKRREEADSAVTAKASAGPAAGTRKKTQQELAKLRKLKKEKQEKEDDLLPEVDQNTVKTLRQRK